MASKLSRDLERQAAEARALALCMIYFAQSGHPGGSLSVADLLTVLWMRHQSSVGQDFPSANEARLILSKGHSVPLAYALAFQSGIISWLDILKFRQADGVLQGHPDVRFTPWIEASTGSLGQGFSVAAGIALGRKLADKRSPVFAILGDGELQEGQVWEAALFANHHDLNNLTAIVDLNGLQSDSRTEDVLALNPLAAKWESFGWTAIELDGHDFTAISSSLDSASRNNRPTVLLARTVKGKGVSYMEGNPEWHGSVAMSFDQLEAALIELGLREYITKALADSKKL